jgi:hypothetical protein
MKRIKEDLQWLGKFVTDFRFMAGVTGVRLIDAIHSNGVVAAVCLGLLLVTFVVLDELQTRAEAAELASQFALEVERARVAAIDPSARVERAIKRSRQVWQDEVDGR